MQYIYIPKVQTLRGEDAIKALNDYVKELAEQKPEELTDKQVTTLTKFAEGLISSVESETSKNVKPKRSFFSGLGCSSHIGRVF
jgi:phage host-nuclease inhibitor protein Gam